MKTEYTIYINGKQSSNPAHQSYDWHSLSAWVGTLERIHAEEDVIEIKPEYTPERVI